MDNEEMAHLVRLLNETKKRRNELEVTAARYGPNRVPAEIKIELGEAQESIERLNAKLRIVTVPTDIQEATGPEAAINVLRLRVHDLSEQFGTMWRYLETLILEDRAATEDWRKKQDRGRRLGTIRQWVIFGILMVGVALALYLAVAK